MGPSVFTLGCHSCHVLLPQCFEAVGPEENRDTSASDVFPTATLTPQKSLPGPPHCTHLPIKSRILMVFLGDRCPTADPGLSETMLVGSLLAAALVLTSAPSGVAWLDALHRTAPLVSAAN